MLIACPACRRQYDVSSFEPGAKVRCFCGEACTVPEPKARQVQMLHCSSCGGRLACGATRCEYCDAEVMLRDRGLGDLCPECFSRLFVGGGYCTTCGVAIRPEVVTKALSSLACPRCKHVLTLRESPTASFTECIACGGLWLDAETFERLKAERVAAGHAAPSAPAAQTTSTPRPEPDVRYLPCPVCGDLMNRKNFALTSGVILDWCRRHGFWFDGGELEAVLRFVDEGGLARAEVREHERRLRQLETAGRKTPGIPTLPLDPHARRWSRANPLAHALEAFLSALF
jgi:Zn-finger nucleic acid-binding protein